MAPTPIENHQTSQAQIYCPPPFRLQLLDAHHHYITLHTS